MLFPLFSLLLHRSRRNLKKKKKNFSALPTLPDDVIEEILSRLPVKSLLRFSSVCRPWRDLIRTPAFHRKHLLVQYNNKRNHHFTPIIGYNLLFVKDYALLSRRRSPTVRPPKDYGVSLRYLHDHAGSFSSCDGLVCFIDRSYTTCVWNPFTGKYRRLPRIEYYGEPLLLALGFGHDPHSNDYLVVLLDQCTRLGSANESYVEIYSFNSNSWTIRKRRIPYSVDVLPSLYNPTLLGGALHWKGRRKTAAYSSVDVILAFDLTSREFRGLQLPPRREMYSSCIRYDVYTFVLDGCLSTFSYCPENNHHVVWKMTEYGVRESWVKLFNLATPQLVSASLVGVSSNGEFMLQDQSGTTIYDSKNQSSRKLKRPPVGMTIVQSLLPV